MNIISKIRAIISDLTETTTEVFVYTASSLFDLGEENSLAILSILKNGVALTTSEYSFDSTIGRVTISASLSTNDIIAIKYTYYAQYSDTELESYIEGALAYLSNNGVGEFRLESADMIYPYPTEKEENLIVLVTSIMIKPNHSKYRTATTSIEYPKTLSKDEKILRTIANFKANPKGLWEVM